MANIDAPSGLTYASGPRMIKHYEVDSSNGTAIFIGDAMIIEDDGNVAPYTGSAGGDLIGVSEGWVAVSTAGTVPISIHPFSIYTIQDDDASGTSAQTHLGNNADVAVDVAGNASTKRSGHQLDISDAASTISQLRIIDKVDTPGNAFGDNCLFYVMINEHSLNSVSAAGV